MPKPDPPLTENLTLDAKTETEIKIKEAIKLLVVANSFLLSELGLVQPVQFYPHLTYWRKDRDANTNLSPPQLTLGIKLALLPNAGTVPLYESCFINVSSAKMPTIRALNLEASLIPPSLEVAETKLKEAVKLLLEANSWFTMQNRMGELTVSPTFTVPQGELIITLTLPMVADAGALPLWEAVFIPDKEAVNG